MKRPFRRSEVHCPALCSYRCVGISCRCLCRVSARHPLTAASGRAPNEHCRCRSRRANSSTSVPLPSGVSFDQVLHDLQPFRQCSCAFAMRPHPRFVPTCGYHNGAPVYSRARRTSPPRRGRTCEYHRYGYLFHNTTIPLRVCTRGDTPLSHRIVQA